MTLAISDLPRHRHTRQHVIAQRKRQIRKWLRYRRCFLERSSGPSQRHTFGPTEWWGQEGRFVKLSLSCDHHALCRLDNWLSKFRRTRSTYYHMLDLYEAEKW